MNINDDNNNNNNKISKLRSTSRYSSKGKEKKTYLLRKQVELEYQRQLPKPKVCILE